MLIAGVDKIVALSYAIALDIVRIEEELTGDFILQRGLKPEWAAEARAQSICHEH